MIRPELDKNIYELSGCYICICDLQQKEQKNVVTPFGDVTLYTPQKYNNNHRTAHPNVGTIVEVFGNTQFKVGQQIICKHSTFENENKTPNSFYEKDDVLYYKVYNSHVMFGVDGEELIPREGILLCEPIYDSLIGMSLIAPDILQDYRRDVTKVIKVWDGCEDYKVGDYLFLEKGGDYLFEFMGKDYIKTDDYFEDVMGVIESPEWRNDEVLKHQKDHSEKTDKST